MATMHSNLLAQVLFFYNIRLGNKFIDSQTTSFEGSKAGKEVERGVNCICLIKEFLKLFNHRQYR